MKNKVFLLLGVGVVLIALWYVITQGFFSQSGDVGQLSTPTPPVTVTERPVATNSSGMSTKQRVNIFLVALDDAGKSGEEVGCGDSLIPVVREVPSTQAVLQVSLMQLFSLNDQYYGESGLYNSLYRSDLQVDSAVVENGKAIIRLSGQISLGGTCDNPRVEGQIRATAMQFATVKTVEIFLNDQPLSEALSLK